MANHIVAKTGLTQLKKYETTLTAGFDEVSLAFITVPISKNNMLVYRNGLLNTLDTDYTFNISTKIIEFTEIFDTNSIITVFWNVPLGDIPNYPTNFWELSDTPTNYTGQANKYLTIKNDETGIEFKDFPNYPTNFWELSDTPANYTGQANKYLTVKNDETGVEFKNFPTSLSPSIITQDTNNRFVTDTEKNTWNSKASTNVATTSTAGLVELATDAEFDTGTDTERYASVAQVRQMRTGWKNLIINGNFDVWQRGTSFTGASIFTADMWRLEDGGGASSIVEKKQEFVDGAYVNVARVTRTNAVIGNFKTVVDEWRYLSGKTLTLSFWARGINTGFTTATYILAEYGVGGSASDGLLLVSTILTTDWQKYVYTFDVPDLSDKTFGNSNKINIYLFRGSTASEIIEISQVQLEIGSCATPFELRPYGLEKMLCLEYFERWKPTGTFDLWGVGTAIGTTQALIPVFFSRKRTDPTITIGGSPMNVYGAGWAKQHPTSVMVNTITPISALFTANVASGLTVGDAIVIGTNDDRTTYIDFSAEIY